jgi:hypothetical protein
MRIAFKEWAVIVDALGTGRQIVILRKGGISEGRGGFHVDHPEFLLFPTLFHQQRESVLPEAQARYDKLDLPGADILRLEYFCRVGSWRQLGTLEAAQRLQGQHVWKPEVISERFDWGKTKAIFALAVRTYRLPKRIDLPMLPTYGGCKSWIELDQEIDTSAATPVLTDPAFAEKLTQFKDALTAEGHDVPK